MYCRGAVNLAARSGRGGTTGLAAGWPANGRGATGWVGNAGDCARGASGLGLAGNPAGLGAIGVPGRTPAGSDPAGIGCRGPDKT
jgi:hypothetical protein